MFEQNAFAYTQVHTSSDETSTMRMLFLKGNLKTRKTLQFFFLVQEFPI